MDIESIRTAIIVAKLKSFNLAAEEIHCAQSTVSRHIKNLENDLNIQIFMRRTNSSSVTLTAEGQKVLPSFELIYSEYDKLKQDAVARDNTEVDKISLGVPNGSVLTPIGKYNLQTDFYLEDPNI